ncbi:MAG: hypothetical protein PHU16_05080 [Atribacterota bacterium]|jgi:hypothetical protein|uniref:hypothetical protein n=1 Tax=Atribacter sp. TaxID=2847780 RepID=UPI00345E97C8|nr:hypothetical protein [Atribacterota bacterium]
MKKILSGVTVALLVVLMVSSFALARGRGDNNYGRQLTGKTVEMSGTIQAIDFTPPQIEIKVDADGKVIEVELGPVKQYDPKDFQIGAAISLTGEFVAENVFLPYSFKVNNKTYELRDADGYPLWTGGKNDNSNRGNQNQNDNWDCRGRCGRNRDGNGRGMMENRGKCNR